MNQTEQKFLQRATEITEANLQNEQFGVNELAEKLGMSRATLHRKIKLNTKKSVSQFICQIRLKKALGLLKQNSATISEIAYSCGFNSVTYFTKCFHDHYGCSPGEAAKRDISENPDGDKQDNEIQPKSGRKKILAGGIILAVLITVLLVIVLVKPFQPGTLPKTIAVLPFINDSKDSSTAIILDGVLEEIIKNLLIIKDMSRVSSRTSVEQYRDNKTKNVKQIAKELDVSYIVEASAQKQGKRIKIHVQLIDAELDKHLFAKDYERDIEDIFDLENEIAILVAKEIGAIITAEEKERIIAKPTKSSKAYMLYLNAADLLAIGGEYANPTIIKQAEPLIRQVISIDTTFSDAYILLARALWGLGKSMDTVIYLANRAIHFNNKNADAYSLSGNIYLWNLSMYDEAENAFKKAIEFNPVDYRGYDGLGDLYWLKGDYELQIKNKLKALQRLKRTSRSYDLTYYLSFQLYALGFFTEGLKLAEELINEYGDSTMYFLGLEAENMNSGNYKEAHKNSLKTGRKFAQDWWWTANILLRLRDFEGTLKLVEDYYANGGQVIPSYYFGYTYNKNGLKEKAAFHFNGVIKEQQKIIKENTGKARGYAYYTLVLTYSAMGDKAKAVETMKKMLEHKDEIPIGPVAMLEFRNHPMCDAIQGTPEHTEILKIAEDHFLPVKKKIEGFLREAGY